MSDEVLTATNDEIYLLVRQIEMRAEALYRKASALTSGGDGELVPAEQQDLSEISPGATNWDIHHDLRQLAETLMMVERSLDEATG